MHFVLCASYFAVLGFLAMYGLHRSHLVITCLRYARALREKGEVPPLASDAPLADVPHVTIQLPLYNEATVAARLLEHEQHEIEHEFEDAIVDAAAAEAQITLPEALIHDRAHEMLEEMLGAMAQKDLSGADGRPDSQDELADAIEAINRMKGSMSDALVEVARSSAQVAAAGTEIEATSRQISETAHDEQRNVEFFASSVARMNATVKDVAGHAERASMAADDAVLTANSGREVVRQSEAAMNRISESVQMASGDIATLGQVTGSIGEVVRIVQDIAEQTNLLALNAAIEAARAGDQGKGFVVVAEEVRVLAERTAKFTKEIAEKIESMQQGTGRAIQSMRQGETVVREGVSQFSQVSTALDAITQRIEAAQQGIAMIATATTQQSAATEGLTESIHSISMEVTKTTNQVDQTALACTELAKLAAVLQNVVNGFQLPAAN